MQIDLLTKEDLEQFRIKLLTEIREIMNVQEQNSFPKSIKSNQVLKILQISPGKLQNLRITGALSFKKVGGNYYYNYNEVKRLLPKE